MGKRFSTPQAIVFARLTSVIQGTFAAAIALNLSTNPSLAGDPFRTSEPRKIGDQTEAAFKAVFQQGNYPAAEKYLQQALSTESNEPLVYAMKASLAYGKKDIATLDSYSKKTLETGEKLIASDPLRGNLYTAVGNFLEGAVIVIREGASGAQQP